MRWSGGRRIGRRMIRRMIGGLRPGRLQPGDRVRVYDEPLDKGGYRGVGVLIRRLARDDYVGTELWRLRLEPELPRLSTDPPPAETGAWVRAEDVVMDGVIADALMNTFVAAWKDYRCETL